MTPGRIDTAQAEDVRSHSRLPKDIPVLIVGGGPSGLLQAYCLQQLGVKTLVIERYPQRLAAPKAHALSPRSLELCRQFGLDTNELRRRGTPRNEAFWVNFITNLSGEQVGYLPYERMDAEVLDDTPQMIHNIPQPKFEEFVSENLLRGSESPVVKNVSFVSCESSNDHVLTTVEDRYTGQHHVIKSRHVIACDGARSKVRDALSIDCEGEDSYETMMTIHFNADLRPVVKDRIGMLHWVMDPEVSGFIIGYDLSGDQVLICNFDSEKHPVNAWDEALCRQTLDAAIGTKVDYKVLSHRPWTLSRKVARQYRKGNVFLAGDAAHSFPPTGGLGLNSGIADVHNLAYKIAAVHQGWGGDGLLDTYEADRRQVAIVNAEQSVKNGKRIFGFLRMLGATVSDPEEARKNLYATIHDPSKADEIAENIEAQREHFDNLALHIGYVYGRRTIPEHASHFTPEVVPGARLPHAWIVPSVLLDLKEDPIDISFVREMSQPDVQLRRFSTLDLCSPPSFTLLNGSSPIAVRQSDSLAAWCGKHNVQLEIRTLGKHYELAVIPGSERWSHLTGLDRGRCILVRPDQHILAVLEENSNVDSVIAVLKAHLDI